MKIHITSVMELLLEPPERPAAATMAVFDDTCGNLIRIYQV